jgi:hypothetical protein
MVSFLWYFGFLLKDNQGLSLEIFMVVKTTIFICVYIILFKKLMKYLSGPANND